MRWALVRFTVDLRDRDAKDRAEACEANGWRMSDASDLYTDVIDTLEGLMTGQINPGRYLAHDIDEALLPEGEHDMMQPQPGDWVTVYGQVVEGRSHPEDLIVEFFSHCDQYQAHVKADRVVKADPPTHLSQRCTHLWQQPYELGYALLRCVKHHSHGGEHEASIQGKVGHWCDGETIGYFEEKS